MRNKLERLDVLVLDALVFDITDQQEFAKQLVLLVCDVEDQGVKYENVQAFKFDPLKIRGNRQQLLAEEVFGDGRRVNVAVMNDGREIVLAPMLTLPK